MALLDLWSAVLRGNLHDFLYKTNDPRRSMLRKFAEAVGCSLTDWQTIAEIRRLFPDTIIGKESGTSTVVPFDR